MSDSLVQSQDPPILFDRQDHQDECIKSIMSALEEGQDGRSLAVRVSFDFHQAFPIKLDENKLDILMETGTGKTYVYLKAIFEMHKRFGKTKFVIIVPRTSIKLGVMQNIRLTANHFFTQYGRRLRCVRYPEDGGVNGVIGGFIRNNELSVLLTTNSAFNSKDNLVNQRHETLDGSMTAWKEIARLGPVVIMDEPHLLTGRQTAEYLKKLRAESLFIRFGATYPKNGEFGAANVVYALDSISAFNSKLVKRIHTDVADFNAEEGNIRVTSAVSRQRFTITYVINGQYYEKIVRYNEDFGAVTGLTEYRGRRVTSIGPKEVALADGTKLPVGAHSLTSYEMRHMVRRTINLHFEREEEMFRMGIKTLSLFFIPQIKDFRSKSPRIKRMFEEEYMEARRKRLAEQLDDRYRQYLEMDYQDGELRVHDGYFSGDRGSKDDREAKGVDLILNNKRKLLSLKEPLRFVFSVWALQEGWDNPNVFNICKLSRTDQDTSRRQQVGRGLRIAVDQYGQRMTEDRLAEKNIDFYEVNDLNMVVSTYEHDFIENIQREIHDASPSIVNFAVTLEALAKVGLTDPERGPIYTELLRNGIIDTKGNRNLPIQDFLESNRGLFQTIGDKRFMEIVRVFQDTRGIIKDRRKSEKVVRVRPSKWKKFKELWENINRRSRIVYKNIDEECIIRDVSKAFNDAHIPKAQAKITRYMYDSQNDKIIKEEEVVTDDPNYFKKMDFYQSVMRMVKDHKWPIGFILKLFSRIDTAKYKANPEEAEKQLTYIIQEAIHQAVLEKVEYQFAETTVYGNGLQDEDGKVRKSLPYTKLGKYCMDETPRNEFLYDTIVYDSEIELESIRHDSMKYEDGHGRKSVMVFAKLPHIRIPTPFKMYSPDFAYVIDSGNGQTLYLVAETKGYDYEREVPGDQQKKIDYGYKFFDALQNTLPKNIEVCFQRRLNEDGMSKVLQRCYSK